MSLEKAVVLKEYPVLIIQFLEQKYKSKINIINIYYMRTDKNLKIKSVILYVEYELQ